MDSQQVHDKLRCGDYVLVNENRNGSEAGKKLSCAFSAGVYVLQVFRAKMPWSIGVVSTGRFVRYRSRHHQRYVFRVALFENRALLPSKLILIELILCNYANPTCSDLAPSDFHLIVLIKKHLGDKRSNTDTAIQQDVMTRFQGLDADFFYTGIDALVYRWNKCLDKHGDYVEK
ncbi:hypothetical protein ANN_01485 [Periplaneta americana]|uniref:Histone-lysine N-methyltransferase SETMAR n=1 Tax=Periplaneta americana TaxID=6978 RepID=A0ABQ8TW53_PERAM|nr:hypothetical protein ANN_01485 [Periplaneta americana]